MNTKSLGILCSLLFIVPGLNAQLTRPNMIPLDVAEELASPFSIMMGSAMPRATIVMGKVTTGLEGKLYLPTTSRPIASIDGMMPTTIISSALPLAETFTALRREMATLGWKSMVDPSVQMIIAQTQDSVISLCRREGSLLIVGRSTGPKESRLTLLSVPQPGLDCTQPAQTSSQPDRMPQRMQIPRLNAPPGANRADCGNYGSSSSELALLIAMPDSALLSFYGKQLADSGWKSVTPDAISRTWTRTDSAGRRDLSLAIMPSSIDANCRRIDVLLRVYR